MKMHFCLILGALCIFNTTFNGHTDGLFYLFSHGVADNHTQAYNYLETSNKQKPYILHSPLITFDYPDVSNNYFKVNRTQTSFAQENEIHQLAKAYFSSIKNTHDSVLAGVSRGASALINFMGIYDPPNVRALILESPFDCVDSICANLINTSKFSWIPGIKNNGTNIARFIFCKYKPKGIRPTDCAPHIRKGLPILIICSQQDHLVPAWSSINLYKMLRDSGHYNTHLLVLAGGQHGKIITNSTYGPIYQNITHAFYQKYGLAHCPNLAQLGQKVFAECQPDNGSLLHLYPAHAKPLSGIKAYAQNPYSKRFNSNNLSAQRGRPNRE